MTKTLDRKRGAQPLYRQLEMILREEIENGQYNHGDVFPCERELMEQFNVSRITVRQALRNLSDLHYISPHPGKGTEVIFSKINENLKEVIPFSEEMAKHGIAMSTSYCVTEYVKPDKNIASVLSTENCFLLQRVRLADGIPLVFSETYIASSWKLPAEADLYRNSLYKYLKEKLGITVTRATDTLEAAACPASVAAFLEIEEGMPVFKRTRRSYAGEKILEYTICYYPADRYKYTVEL